jgi:nucleolin
VKEPEEVVEPMEETPAEEPKAEEEVVEEPKAEEVVEEPKAEEVVAEEPKEEEPKAEEEKPEEPKAEEEQKVEDAPVAENPNGETELFVGNLSYNVNEDQIAEFFGVYGEIANVKLLQRDGRPAGKGFVSFNNPDDAAKAKAANGMDFQGRPIQVRFASDPIPQQQDRQGGSPRRAQNPNTIFVGGLSYNSTSDTVGEFFGQCGNVTNVRVATDPEGNPRGFAHVEFDTAEAVTAALALTGSELDGRSIRVDTAGAKGEKPAGRFGAPQGGRPPRRGGFGGPRRGGFGGGFGGRPAGPSAGIDAAKKKGTMQGFAGKKMKLE